MGKTQTFEIWFEHDNGPYCITGNYESRAAVVHFWQDDPFFIGCNVLGDSEHVPEVVQEWKRQRMEA